MYAIHHTQQFYFSGKHISTQSKGPIMINMAGNNMSRDVTFLLRFWFLISQAFPVAAVADKICQILAHLRSCLKVWWFEKQSLSD